jgi:hypothetical protein
MLDDGGDGDDGADRVVLLRKWIKRANKRSYKIDCHN